MPKMWCAQRSDFLDTDRQVSTVVMETAQLVLSQFKNC